MNKGSILLSAKMPRNYFYYDEKVPIEINIDCTKLKDLHINFINLIFLVIIKKNYSDNYLKVFRKNQQSIYSKRIDLDKGLNEYKISEVIEIPKDYKNYTPKVYNEIDKMGPIEVKDSFHQNLYQSSYNGLVSVDYIIRICLGFDSSLTFDENLDIPIYFFS